MNRIRLQIFVPAAALLVSVGGAAGALTPPGYPDPLAIFGTGRVGSWTTELTLSNPLDEAMTAEVKTSPGEIVCVLPCDFTHELPARGTIVLGPPAPDSVGVTYVTGIPGTDPRVLARVLDANGRSVDLPVFRLSALLALDASELVFPGARRSPEGSVNLLLANLVDPIGFAGDAVTLELEAIDANGTSLGSRDVTLAKGETLFMTDALGFLGVGVVEVGQLSVRRVAGAGKFWGALFIRRADGSLSVSIGTTP